MRKSLTTFAIGVPLVCLLSAGIYSLPPVHDRLAWRVDELVLRIKYTLNPPGKVVFVPQEMGTATLSAPQVIISTATHTPPPTQSTTPQTSPSATPMPSLAPTKAQTPLPERVELKGVRYEDQHGRLNYCAPANLAMALSFWGWRGNRDVVGPVLKPDDKDKNVMPYEMAWYVENETDLKVVSRQGGDIELVKRLLAAGYPVLVEIGVYFRDLTGVVSWMGHYRVINGYDDGGDHFIVQDSFVKADHTIAYEDMIPGWRGFNYTYLVIYPPEQEAEVFDLLGPDADETNNLQNAALKASNEIYGLSGIDQYLAWYNRGASLAALQDFGGAALAFDEAFNLYPTIPEAERPWRILWYRTDPYRAYFYTQRYYDVLYLADGTLNAMQSDKNLEESYYWRGMAKAALGDTAGAIEDFRLALLYHPGFEPAIYQLSLLGVENP